MTLLLIMNGLRAKGTQKYAHLSHISVVIRLPISNSYLWFTSNPSHDFVIRPSDPLQWLTAAPLFTKNYGNDPGNAAIINWPLK